MILQSGRFCKMMSEAKYADVVRIVSLRLVASLTDYMVEVVRLGFAQRLAALFALVRAHVPNFPDEEVGFGSSFLYPLLRALTDFLYRLPFLLLRGRDPEGKRRLPSAFGLLRRFGKPCGVLRFGGVRVRVSHILRKGRIRRRFIGRLWRRSRSRGISCYARLRDSRFSYSVFGI